MVRISGTGVRFIPNCLIRLIRWMYKMKKKDRNNAMLKLRARGLEINIGDLIREYESSR